MDLEEGEGYTEEDQGGVREEEEVPDSEQGLRGKGRRQFEFARRVTRSLL